MRARRRGDAHIWKRRTGIRTFPFVRDAKRSARSAANLLTASRLLSAPLLVAAALLDLPRLFASLAVWGLLSDVADGAIARALQQTSARGAELDSLADLACYSAIIAGLAILMPERLLAEWHVVVVVLLSYVVPILVGWIKFGRLTSYHTLLARLALTCLVAGVAVWLIADNSLLLQLATAVLALSAAEELLITLKLQQARSNVPHLFAVQTFRRGHTTYADRTTAGSGTPVEADCRIDSV